MLRKALIYFVCQCIWLCGGRIHGQGKPVSDTLAAGLHSYLNEASSKGFSGSVLVFHDGKSVIDETFGIPGNAKRGPAFWLASNSKPILAVAILKLQEQGRLSIDDPIIKFFKEVPADKRQITIRNLLTHTSGLPHRYVAEGVTDRDQAVRAVFGVPLEWKIGEGWHYANTNFYLLAAIVEIASGKTFEQYLQKELFDAAGMRESGFWGFQNNAPLAPSPNPMMMQKLKPEIYKDGASVANWGYRGATGLFSTAADLLKLIRALRSGRILAKHTLELMWSPLVFIRRDPQSDVYSGLGWYVVTQNGKRIAVRHTGSEDVIGHNGVIWAYENGDAVIVLSNAGERNGQGISGPVSSGINKILSTPSPVSKGIRSRAARQINTSERLDRLDWTRL